jgi:cell division protein FtsX
MADETQLVPWLPEAGPAALELPPPPQPHIVRILPTQQQQQQQPVQQPVGDDDGQADAGRSSRIQKDATDLVKAVVKAGGQVSACCCLCSMQQVSNSVPLQSSAWCDCSAHLQIHTLVSCAVLLLRCSSSSAI